MFDGLRNNDNDNSSTVEFFPEETPVASKPRSAVKKRRSPGKFLGMTPQQRFILAVILMITVCLLGSMCMLLTGRFVLPL